MTFDVKYMAFPSPPSFLQAMEHKLKEAEEMHVMLQLECEKYKAVLAETVGNRVTFTQ